MFLGEEISLVKGTNAKPGATVDDGYGVGGERDVSGLEARSA